LVQQEVHLAKAELRESLGHVRTMATGLAVAAALAIPGALALTAFLVIGLGALIGSYWASALIVGVVLMTAAVVLGRRAMSIVNEGKIGLPRTITSLAEDATWGKEELRAFKREMTA
ncbi:MAG TPA: phage holin family protein, partial [Gemmatimonadaceae bacterium]